MKSLIGTGCNKPGSRVDAVMRVLTSHQCRPGPILTQCLMWVEFVVGSRLAPRVFSGSLVFLSPKRPTLPNSTSIRPGDPHENQLKLCCFLS